MEILIDLDVLQKWLHARNVKFRQSFWRAVLAKTVKNFDGSYISRQNILECHQTSVDNKLTNFFGYRISNVINVIARQQTNEVKLFM